MRAGGYSRARARPDGPTLSHGEKRVVAPVSRKSSRRGRAPDPGCSPASPSRTGRTTLTRGDRELIDRKLAHFVVREHLGCAAPGGEDRVAAADDVDVVGAGARARMRSRLAMLEGSALQPDGH
jgi:hypothetical protein